MLPFLEISNLGFGIWRYLSLLITNFVLKGIVHQFTSVHKEIIFIVILKVYYI